MLQEQVVFLWGRALCSCSLPRPRHPWQSCWSGASRCGCTYPPPPPPPPAGDCAAETSLRERHSPVCVRVLRSLPWAASMQEISGWGTGLFPHSVSQQTSGPADGFQAEAERWRGLRAGYPGLRPLMWMSSVGCWRFCPCVSVLNATLPSAV